VARDASGNFSAGTITATLSGAASSATNATFATSATNASAATNATFASSATNATFASSATNASAATNATYATSAGSATNATFATTAGSVGTLTAAQTASGASVDFTGIPSSTKRITMNLYNVSVNANSTPLLIQIGAGSYVTSGYLSTSGAIASAVGFSATPSTAGFNIAVFEAAATNYGCMEINLVGSNIWVASGVTGSQGGSYTLSFHNSGQLSLGGTLDRVRITAGGASFDSGSISILYS
jgi:hypothetical protein